MPSSRRAARTRDTDRATLNGPIRVDPRTKNLTKRLKPGDIAVINHEDLDQVSAQALVACQPVAVINAAASTSGAYPNLGPQILVEAGIPLVDRAGEEIMTQVVEGAPGRLSEGVLWVGDERVASGDVLTEEVVRAAFTAAEGNLGAQIEAFTKNTLEYIRAEQHLLSEGFEVPDLRTDFVGRYVLVVVRGYHYKEDLQTLRPFIREAKPVLIGVDGGADALLELGYTPDVIVGDMDSVTERALRSGAEVIVHAYRDGRAPGLDRVKRSGVKDPIVLAATGTSEDIAMLIADSRGADLIVAVGTHATLVEFLDKGRKGMASTFLTRLRVGSKLVDAKGVSQLYRSRISSFSLIWLVLAGLLAVTMALLATPGGRTLLGVVQVRLDDIWAWLGGLFP